MKLFNRRKKQNDKQGKKNLLTQKIIKALNYTPVDYNHSDKFLNDGQDPVEAARKKLAGTNPDNLCDTMLDPSIDADTLNENVYGKQQRIHHINTILQLTDSALEEAVKAPFLRTVLMDDREKLVQEREKLLKIQESL